MSTNITTKEPAQLHVLYSFELWQAFIMMAFCFLILNVPYLFSAEFIFSMYLFILFEFILLHSNVFMSFFYPWGFIIFLPFYGCFAYFLNESAPDNSIMIFFILTMLMRCRGVFAVDVYQILAINIARSFAGLFFLFFSGAIASIVSSIFPTWGLTKEFLNSIDFYSISNSRNANANVHPIIMTGLLYYFLQIGLEWKISKYSIEVLNKVPTDKKLEDS